MLVCYNERVGHLYVPNQKARLQNEKNGYFVVTNSLGFRSALEYEKGKGSRPRILMFGCSYTAGDNVSNEPSPDLRVTRPTRCQTTGPPVLRPRANRTLEPGCRYPGDDRVA